MSFSIVCDAAVDLPQEFLDEIFVIPTFVIIDGKEYRDDEITVDELLNEFTKGKYSKTSQPSPELYQKGYQKAVDKGLPILGIHISSKLSGTFNGANLAIQDFPGEDIVLFDTHNVSFGAGYFVLMAIKLRHLGYSRDEVIKMLYLSRSRVHIQVVIDDIAYLRQGGRVNLGQYWFLKIFRLKPILTNDGGYLVRDGFKFRLKGSAKRLANKIQTYDDFGTDRFVGIGHVNTPDIRDAMRKKAKQIPHQDYMEIRITATLLSHTGPKAIGMLVGPSCSSLETFYRQ